MEEKTKISMLYSWPVIIIALCLFWPVAVFLIIKRVRIDKKAALTVGRIIGFVSGFSFFMAFLGIFVCISDGFPKEDIIATLFFAAAGFVLNRLSKKLKGDAERVKQYLAVIINENVHKLDDIAEKTGRSYETVKNDIEAMIQKGYLLNAYIDENLREVVLSGSARVKSEITVDDNIQPDEAPVTRVVTCRCCGANNTISGTSGECEYCGSPLKL